MENNIIKKYCECLKEKIYGGWYFDDNMVLTCSSCDLPRIRTDLPKIEGKPNGAAYIDRAGTEEEMAYVQWAKTLSDETTPTWPVAMNAHASAWYAQEKKKKEHKDKSLFLQKAIQDWVSNPGSNSDINLIQSLRDSRSSAWKEKK